MHNEFALDFPRNQNFQAGIYTIPSNTCIMNSTLISQETRIFPLEPLHGLYKARRKPATAGYHRICDTSRTWLIALLYSLIAHQWIGCQSLSWSRPKAIYFRWLGLEVSAVAMSTWAQPMFLFCFRFPVLCLTVLRLLAVL